MKSSFIFMLQLFSQAADNAVKYRAYIALCKTHDFCDGAIRELSPIFEGEHFPFPPRQRSQHGCKLFKLFLTSGGFFRGTFACVGR
jgi:hypothetical protein